MAFSDELAVMNADCSATFGVSVTYRSRASGAMNTTTTTRAKTDTDTTVAAIRGQSQEDFEQPGKVEVVEYDILASAFSSRPDGGDVIVDGSVSRTVRKVTLSVDQAWYKLETYRKLL